MSENDLNPILSICIPTYNRPFLFLRMLNELLSQIIENGEQKFQIVVRDDSPSNETQNLFIEQLNKTSVPYKYYRGSKIGLDSANIFLIQNADANHLWLFSDDDEFIPGALKAALGVLQIKPSLNYMWANFLITGPNLPAITAESRFFIDKNDALNTIGPNLGLLSTHILRVDLAKESLKIAKEFVTGFSFAGMVPALYALSMPGQSYLLGHPYVLNHPTTISEIQSITTKNGNFVKNDGFYVHGILFFKTIMRFKNNFSRTVVRSILGKNFSSLWRGILVGWVGGWDSPSGKRWLMLKYYWTYPECWIAFPLLCLPRRINAILYGFYKLFFANRRLKIFTK